MSNNLKIVQSVYSGHSQREVARLLHVGRNRVARLVAHAQAQGWRSLEDLASLDEATFSAALSEKDGAARDVGIQMPDYEQVHAELAKPNVTLHLLWEEYAERCRAGGLRFYQETQFRHHYHQYALATKATLRLEHKPGMAMQVDWAGTRIPYGDPLEEEIEQASLFVAVLPCSRLIYAEVFRTQELACWIRGHINAFTYMGGVAKTIVPDNLKTGVTSADAYEPKINPSYNEMAAHYGSVVLPARVNRPTDKAAVENAVRIASRQIIARLRNITITSFSELHRRVSDELEAVNTAKMKEGNVSRWTSYLEEEKDHMLTLPVAPYELAFWTLAKVQVNCHIAFEKRFYSVPYEYIGQIVDVRTTDHTVEIFYHQERVASHLRRHGKERYATVVAHMPPGKLFYLDWDRARFLRWAGSIGSSTRDVIKAILDRAVIEQQAYRSCFGLLALARRYGDARLESCCRRTLELTQSPSYRQIKDLLAAGEKEKNRKAARTTAESSEDKEAPRGFTRGKEYYGGLS